MKCCGKQSRGEDRATIFLNLIFNFSNMGKMGKEPEGRPKEARVAGIKNKQRRAEEMKKIRREKKKV